jgi:hypothetical protein
MKREWKNEQKSFRDNLDVSMSMSMSMSMRDDLGSPGADGSRDLIEVRSISMTLTMRLIINGIRWHV